MMRQIPLPLPVHAAMGVDDFLVTPSNRDAVSWIDRWPDWPSHGLIVTGLEGSGKTHLVNLWLGKSGGRLLDKPALLAENASELGTHPLAIDNADTCAGHAAAEEKLFHLYNHLKAARISFVLTMGQGAGQAGFLLPDLRSRLVTLPAVALGPPDDELLQALIVKQFRDRQIAVDTGVVTYLASRGARDAAGIRDLISRLDHAALAEGRKITTTLARQVLGDNHDK